MSVIGSLVNLAQKSFFTEVKDNNQGRQSGSGHPSVHLLCDHLMVNKCEPHLGQVSWRPTTVK